MRGIYFNFRSVTVPTICVPLTTRVVQLSSQLSCSARPPRFLAYRRPSGPPPAHFTPTIFSPPDHLQPLIPTRLDRRSNFFTARYSGGISPVPVQLRLICLLSVEFVARQILAQFVNGVNTTSLTPNQFCELNVLHARTEFFTNARLNN